MGVIVGWTGRGRARSGAVLAIAATLASSAVMAIPGPGGVAGAAPGDRSPLVQIRATPAGDLGLSDVAGVTFNAASGALVLADAAVERVLSRGSGGSWGAGDGVGGGESGDVVGGSAGGSVDGGGAGVVGVGVDGAAGSGVECAVGGVVAGCGGG